MMEINQQDIDYIQEKSLTTQYQSKQAEIQLINFDSLFRDMLLPQLNSTQKDQFTKENQKWWFKQQYAFGMINFEGKEIIKISLYKDFNQSTDIQISFKDINNIIYKITLTPIIYLLPFDKDLAELSSDREYVVSNIEIFGCRAFQMSGGIQIALATKRLTIREIEEMIESSIIQEHNTIQLFKQIKPAL